MVLVIPGERGNNYGRGGVEDYMMELLTREGDMVWIVICVGTTLSLF